jgi:hypothetical protein
VKTKRAETWKKAWKKAAGEKVLVGPASFETEVVTKKGYQPVQLRSQSWTSAAETAEVPNTITITSNFEKEGRELLPATPDAALAVDRAWELLERTSFTKGKLKPPVGCFRDHMDAGSRCLGTLLNGTVYINEQHASGGQNKMLTKTALEECVHYVTGSTDMSRDFQDFVLRLVVELALA